MSPLPFWCNSTCGHIVPKGANDMSATLVYTVYAQPVTVLIIVFFAFVFRVTCRFFRCLNDNPSFAFARKPLSKGPQRLDEE